MRSNRYLRISALVMLLCVLLAAMGKAAFAAPGNDDRASAVAIAEPPYSDLRDTSGATLEASEPQPSCADIGATVWYKIRPTVSTRLSLQTFGSKFDTVLAVYADSPSGLRQVACNDDAEHVGSLQSQTSFIAEGDATAYVQVGGFEGASGSLKLTASTDPRPANDDFANAQLVTGFPFSAVAKLSEATLEAGEPNACYGSFGASVWYKISTSSLLTIVAETPEAYSIIDVYQGSNLTDLNLVACNQDGYTDEVRLGTIPGSVYYLRVANSSYYNATDRTLTIEAIVPPANDGFNAAISIDGVPFRHEVDNSGASLESLEPYPDCVYSRRATIWYKVTTTDRQPLLVSTVGSQEDTFVAVYEGSGIGDLMPIACSANAGIGRAQAMVGFFTEPGRTFFIQVGSESTPGRTITEVRYGASAEAEGVAQVGAGWDGDTLEAGGGAAYIVGGGGAVVADTSGETNEDVCAWLFVTIACL